MAVVLFYVESGSSRIEHNHKVPDFLPMSNVSVKL
jgi:hypothetical protein